jgi:predicted permease
MFRRKRSQSDFNAEIRAHIELEAARLRERGMSPAAALAAAHRTFGNLTAAQERFHDSTRWLWLDYLRQDLRLAVRLLARTPGWTTVCILTAALGIGASVAMFSVVYASLLRPLPYPDADRLYWINERATYTVNSETTSGNSDAGPFSNLERLGRTTNVFESLAAFDYARFTWFAESGPVGLQGSWVTASLFPTLGAQPLHGRTIRQEDVTGVAVISHRFWQRAFGGDASAVGKSIRVAVRGEPMLITVVGVMAPEFDFPNHQGALNMDDEFHPDLWTPWPFAVVPGGIVSRIVARAAPAASTDQIAAEMTRFSELLRADLPPGQKPANRRDYVAISLKDHLAGRARRPVLIFAGAVALMLLIVCFNIANLLAARATARQREIAVRLALGSPRHRVIRQLLTESLLISTAGGLTGVALGEMALAAFNGSPQAASLGVPTVTMDTWVIAFAVGLTMLTGLVFGLAPAFGSLGFTVRDALERESRSAGSSGGLRRLRQALVVGQVAFSLTLLIGAGLLGKCFLQIWATDPGFDPQNVVTSADHNIVARDQPRLAEQLRSLPGVQVVAFTSAAPGTGAIGGINFSREGYAAERLHSQIISVTPEYFAALRVLLRAGRLLTIGDAGSVPVPVVVNENFAHKFYPDQNPLGKRIIDLPLFRNETAKELVIVGTVGDFRQHELERDPELMVYALLTGPGSPVVRSSLEARPLVPVIRNILAPYNPNRPPPDVKTVEQRFSEALSGRRFNAVLIGSFSLIAMFLAAIGIYGLMSYMVALRAREMGVRMTLGARPAQVLRMILREGAVLGVIGAVLGISGAAGLNRFLASMLLNVSPFDPSVFATFTAVLLTAVVVACYVPGRRAAHADPMIVLRHE